MIKHSLILCVTAVVLVGLISLQLNAQPENQHKAMQLSLTYYYYPYINYDYSPYNYSPYDYSPYSLPYGYSYPPPVVPIITDTAYRPALQKCRVQVQNQHYYGLIAQTGGCRVNYNGRLMETHSFEVLAK